MPLFSFFSLSNSSSGTQVLLPSHLTRPPAASTHYFLVRLLTLFAMNCGQVNYSFTFSLCNHLGRSTDGPWIFRRKIILSSCSLLACFVAFLLLPQTSWILTYGAHVGSQGCKSSVKLPIQSLVAWSMSQEPLSLSTFSLTCGSPFYLFKIFNLLTLPRKQH